MLSSYGTCSTNAARKAAGDCKSASNMAKYEKVTTDTRHTAAPPTAYGTVMNYVVLRLLGMGPDEGPMTEIRALIHKMGESTSLLCQKFLMFRRCYDRAELGKGLAIYPWLL